MISGCLNDLGCPDNSTAGIIATEDGHDHTVCRADIFKSPENGGWNIEDITFFENYLPGVSMEPPEKPPATGKNEEHFCGVMVVK